MLTQTTLELVLSGFHIGLHLVAIYFVLKIALMRDTPSMPYVLILMAFLLQTFLRVNGIVHFLSPLVILGLQMTISVFAMLAFGKVYSLLKKRV